MKKKPKTEKPKTIPFKNNKGDIIHVPEDAKIGDLFKMGFTEFRFGKKGSFLPNGWYMKQYFPPEQKKSKKGQKQTK